MRAVTIRESRVFVEVHPDLEPGSNDVLIATGASGLNNADLVQIRGGYPAPPGSPPTSPGLELAGTVLGYPTPSPTRS